MPATALEKLRRTGPTFRARDARDAGLHWRDLYALRDAGEIVELSRGLYRFADADGVTEIDLLAVHRRAPRGMVCLVSALAHWELTDEIPAVVHYAVPRGTRRPTIAYPPTQVFLFDATTFGLGRQMVELAPREAVAMSSPERSVVDVFRYRRRLGTDLAYGALRRYLGQSGAQPAEVARLAAALRVRGPVRQAMEVLLS